MSVTTIIKQSGVGPDYSAIPEAYMNGKAALGQKVHDLCADAKLGRVRIPTGEVGSYVLAFVEWLKNSGAVVMDTEFEMRGRACGVDYVGHPDLLVKWNHLVYLLDIKITSSLYSSYGLQLAGYMEGCKDRSVIHRRGVLWLRKDEPAKIVSEAPIVRESDYRMFRALLTSRAWIIGAKL